MHFVQELNQKNMIDTFVVEEMLLQLEQNKNFIKRLTNRLKIETSIPKRNNFLKEIGQATETNIEIKEMLVLEYEQGITREKLTKDIQR